MKYCLQTKMEVLCFRNQMWINAEINKFSETNLNSKWISLRSNKLSDKYWGCNTSILKIFQKVSWDMFDIKDLHKLGTKLCLCFYYLQKMLISQADLIFMPYNYSLDQRVRSQFEVNFENP